MALMQLGVLIPLLIIRRFLLKILSPLKRILCSLIDEKNLRVRSKISKEIYMEHPIQSIL